MKQSYHVVESGRHSSRRDYSKVSGQLELPYLVEIQTDSFKTTFLMITSTESLKRLQVKAIKMTMFQ